MAICLDEFQEIQKFDSGTVENVIRNAVQRQRQIGYIFCGSQPTLMDQMLAPRRPFHKSGPRVFLEKIPGDVWRGHIRRHFARRGRVISEAGVQELLVAADLIPYDVQRLAHELWDYAELADRKEVGTEDLQLVVERLASSQGAYYEQQWQRLTLLQRRVLQALAVQGAADLTSQAVRQKFRLGPASSTQKALLSLDAQDILDRYEGRYFFVDPLMAIWIRQGTG